MSPSARRRKTPKRKLVLQESDEEEIFEEEPNKETVAEGTDETTVDEPAVEDTTENIIAQVLEETAEIKMVETYLEEPVPVATYNLCGDIVAAGQVVDIEVSTEFIGVFRRGLDVNLISSIPSSSNVSPMHFTLDDISQTPPTNDIPLDEATTADIPQIFLPSTYYTESINEVRRYIQTQKASLTQNMDDIRKEVQDQKAALAHDFLEFRVETQENFNTLSAHLAEINSYINRRDDKNGEDSSSQGPQPPGDQSRPSGGGSRSEPPRKRGGGLHRGGGTSSRGFHYWFG
ncbi:conserved oligomeric Golgi complex subunit 2 [Dorcoceras hygrometricum]|uniref:Conserved oligomeric Golgi complex subunit 2 n=1 Tax=Dorcoceras hygrometricum TaxID=472368 RepID=A0A2Z7AYT2_9LAMI|nr:conserved oligomeric Golgi complex subunit 2 [Dorcoceras hygrometricum]